MVVGAPAISSISGPTSIRVGQYVSFTAIASSSLAQANGMQWIINDPTSGATTYNSLSGVTNFSFGTSFPHAGGYQVVCRLSNSCGLGESYALSVYVSNTGSYSIATPNPVSNTLNVSFDDSMVTQARASMQQVIGSSQPIRIFMLTVKLYDDNGILQRQTTSTGQDVDLDVSGLPDGIYFLHVHDGIAPKPEIQKIIVKH